jgi:hypothetical protein
MDEKPTTLWIPLCPIEVLFLEGLKVGITQWAQQ